MAAPKAHHLLMKTLMKSGGPMVIIMHQSDRASDTTSMLDGVLKVLTLEGAINNCSYMPWHGTKV